MRHGSESSTLETDVCVWRYAPLVVHATQEEEEDGAVGENSVTGYNQYTLVNNPALLGLAVELTLVYCTKCRQTDWSNDSRSMHGVVFYPFPKLGSRQLSEVIKLISIVIQLIVIQLPGRATLPKVCNTRKLCYSKDDRAMRAI